MYTEIDYLTKCGLNMLLFVPKLALNTVLFCALGLIVAYKIRAKNAL